MQYLVLKFLDDFACLAGDCPSSCCIGWKILVDKEAYERFKQIEPKWLQEEILQGIEEKDGKYYFKNQKAGSCIMLQQDHLCKIQKHTKEAMLCNTCRKYPRISNRIEDIVCISMAASCPAFARRLVTEKLQWKWIDKQKITLVSLCDIKAFDSILSFQKEMEEIAIQYEKQQEKEWIIYQCFEKMADDLLEILPYFREKDDFFQYLSALEEDRTDEECVTVYTAFCTLNQTEWVCLKENYISYRTAGCLMEYPKMGLQEVYIQSCAELFVIRLLVFCIFLQKKRKVRVGEWEQAIGLVYRLCVHGEKVSQKLQEIFENFFRTPFLWSFILL